tara:strand:- start:3397 stop:4974 length:1578 start_codon:yes stop_codon:yes gene_type:complete
MFRIEYLKLTEHPQLGNIELFLSDIDEIDNIDKPYTSLIIGPNGTGKSFILRTISDILTQFNIFQTSGVRSINLPFSFNIRYKFEKDTFEITSSFIVHDKNKVNRTFNYYKNRPFTPINVKSEKDFKIYKIDFKDLLYPSHVIVNSVMLNDRFLFRNCLPTDFYQYLGVRSTSSTASTKSAVKGLVNNLFSESVTNENFLTNLKDLLFFLEFENKFEVEYNTKLNKLFFTGDLTVKDFKQYYEFWWDDKFTYSKRDKNNPIWSKPFYDKFYKSEESKIEEIVNYLNFISKSGRLGDKYKSTSKYIRVDFLEENINKDEFWKIIDLEKLDIINVNGIKLSKNNSNMNISDISSGEYHLLISLIGIFSKIKENSLVLIDEPEISLHPNWQMQYITFLKNIFSKYPSCHFIITSHSHFIVSDLEGESSSVTSLMRNEENKLESTLIKADTFGWSAEDILYNVFKVLSTRNLYVAKEIGEILKIISKKDIDQKILNNKKEKLSYIKSHLKNEDPLKSLIEKVEKEFING